jgi:hypothetical protein
MKEDPMRGGRRLSRCLFIGGSFTFAFLFEGAAFSNDNVSQYRWCQTTYPSVITTDAVPSEFRDAISFAMNRWNSVGTPFQFIDAGVSFGNYYQPGVCDSRNVADYAPNLEDPWNRVGETTWCLSPWSPPEIIEANSIPNSLQPLNPGPACPGGAQYGATRVMPHEFGHWLRLLDSQYSPLDAMYSPIFAGDCNRELSSHDELGIQALYPAGDSCGGGGGGGEGGCVCPCEPSSSPSGCGPVDFHEGSDCVGVGDPPCPCVLKYVELDDCSVAIPNLACDADDEAHGTPVGSPVAGFGVALARVFEQRLQRSEAGRGYLGKWALHNREVYEILSGDPVLRRKAKITLNDFMSALRYFLFNDVKGENVLLTPERLGRLQALADEIKSRGSDRLREDLGEFVERLRRQEGRTVSEAISAMLAAE